MTAEEIIDGDEIILRSIPPSAAGQDSITQCDDGSFRPASFRMCTKPSESGLSCTRLRQTSPQELLDQLILDGNSTVGWMVCWMRASDIRQIGLEVIYKPTNRDIGHREIRGENPTGGICDFPSKRNGKLAKIARILSDDVVANLRAGDDFPSKENL